MPAPILQTARIIDALPLPAFVATEKGELVYANDTLRKIAGQPKLSELHRTLFGLGIFNNPAEYRGFLRSFRHGGTTRRLSLPQGRLEAGENTLILSATRIEWDGEDCLFGVLENRNIDIANRLNVVPSEGIRDHALIDAVSEPILILDFTGKFLHANPAALTKLGYSDLDDLPPLHVMDVENGEASLKAKRRSFSLDGKLSYDTTLRCKDNSLAPVKIRWQTISNYYPGKAACMLSLSTIQNRLTASPEHKDQSSVRAPVIVTENAAYLRTIERAVQVAITDSTVLITGETGTGKELIARTVHAYSTRARAPMVILNCGALPSELIESELFGYRAGAFTGAKRDHPGRFEVADGGTLFLDEIGEMPLALQTRLLRVLDTGEYTPLGARKSKMANVRIIAATNRSLKQWVTEGHFRTDLYFRLNVFPISTLPLRERPEDIRPLVDLFIRRHADPAYGELPHLAPSDYERLLTHPFSGNVRELENLIQRSLIINAGKPTLRLEFEDFKPLVQRAEKATPLLTFVEMQRAHIIRALKRTEGKVSGPGGAAELLGLKDQTLFSKMRKLGIDR